MYGSFIPDPALLEQRMGVGNQLLGAIAGRAGDVIAFPRRAMEQGLTTEQAVPWATDMAMNTFGSMAPFAMRGTLGSAGGKMGGPMAPKPDDPTEIALRAIQEALALGPQRKPTSVPVVPPKLSHDDVLNVINDALGRPTTRGGMNTLQGLLKL